MEKNKLRLLKIIKYFNKLNHNDEYKLHQNNPCYFLHNKYNSIDCVGCTNLSYCKKLFSKYLGNLYEQES